MHDICNHGIGRIVFLSGLFMSVILLAWLLKQHSINPKMRYWCVLLRAHCSHEIMRAHTHDLSVVKYPSAPTEICLFEVETHAHKQVLSSNARERFQLVNCGRLCSCTF